MKVESGTVNKPSGQKPSTEKKTEKTQNKTAPSTQSKASSQSAPSNQIKVKDKVQLSDKAQEKLKSEKKEEKSVFQSAYDWITGQREDSSKLIDEEKQKEFQEKLKKENPEKYKQYMKDQINSDQHIIEAKEKAGDAFQEGLERATDVDTLVKSGITGADEYALKKQNKEAEEKQMELAKNKDSNKDQEKIC